MFPAAGLVRLVSARGPRRHGGRSVGRGGAARQGRREAGETRPGPCAAGPREARAERSAWYADRVRIRLAGARALVQSTPPWFQSGSNSAECTTRSAKERSPCPEHGGPSLCLRSIGSGSWEPPTRNARAATERDRVGGPYALRRGLRMAAARRHAVGAGGAGRVTWARHPIAESPPAPTGGFGSYGQGRTGRPARRTRRTRRGTRRDPPRGFDG